MNTRSNINPHRRQFVGLLGAAAAGIALGRTASARATRNRASSTGSPPLSTNQYPWHTFYQRGGRSFTDDLAASVAEVARSGADALEPNIESIEMVDAFARALEEHGMRMPSLYVNCLLHEPAQADASIDRALRIATRALGRCGTSILVTNPAPISWGGPENKTDSQILAQGKALDRLGASLRREGITLAYHNHDSELRLAAREFHHMFVSTDPDNVKFCLDAHWIYRGAGNSSVALFDAIELYGNRVVELHVRQSRNGVWTETFGEGDIDYERLVKVLAAKGVRPLIVAEQCVEAATPSTLDALAAHKITHAAVRKTFAPLL